MVTDLEVQVALAALVDPNNPNNPKRLMLMLIRLRLKLMRLMRVRVLMVKCKSAKVNAMDAAVLISAPAAALPPSRLFLKASLV